jgi:hypothetical protein
MGVPKITARVRAPFAALLASMIVIGLSQAPTKYGGVYTCVLAMLAPVGTW